MLPGAQRARCIRIARLGIIIPMLTGLIIILTNNVLYGNLTFQIKSDQSCTGPSCKMKPKASNRLVVIDTKNGQMKGPKQNSEITPTNGTKPSFPREIPIIEAKNQPERLRNLPFFHCYKYTCEVPPNFPELRLNESPVVPSSRNVTPGRSSVVFFNRVNKCGSSTFKVLIRRLRAQNHYQAKSSKIFLERGLSWKNQEELAGNVSQMPSPLVFDRHVYYINFTRYGLEPPIWINIVREPVERFISLFYYHRQPVSWLPSRNLPKFYKRPPKWWFDKDLDICIHKNDPECVPKPGGARETVLTFFCGHHPACMEIGNRGALQRAKRRVETEYSVVAVLEDLSTSMRVLEHYVPRFFRGVSEVLANEPVHRNSGTAKRNVTESTKQLLRNMMALDIEFYNFVKQRLHLQSERLPK